MVDEHADMKPELEDAFFLGYPDLLTYKSIGRVVSLFEDENLKLKGMRLMHVNKSFIKKHFENAGKPEGENRYTRYNSWDGYLTCTPVLAMILEGEKAVNKVKNITSIKKNESLFWIEGGPTFYISKSAPEATQDIELWFRKDSEGWLNEMIGSKDLIYVHPDKSDGPWETAFAMLQNDVMCDPKPDLQQYYDMAKMSVVVIKPKAFGEYCVGEILRAVEVNGFGIRGLKLVRKAECPASDVWLSDSCTSSESGVNDYALAMVVDYLRPGLELLQDEPDAKHCDFSSRVCRVGRNYIYKSTMDSWKRDMNVFFPYGLILWVNPECEFVCGNRFEASLIGLRA